MSDLTRAILLGVIIGITGLIISLTPPGYHLEEGSGLSLLYKLRGQRQAPNDVTIVSIDKLSSTRHGLDEDPRKWPRSLHAKLVNILSERGASVIAFDLFFNESRSHEDDLLFARSISSAGNVILNEYVKQEVLFDEKGQIINELHVEKHISPISSLSKPAAAVAYFPLPKVPHRVNQYWTFKPAAGDVPTLPLVTFQLFALDSYKDSLQHVYRYLSNQKDTVPLETEKDERTNIMEIMKALRGSFSRNPARADQMLEELLHADTVSGDVRKASLMKSLINMYRSPGSLYLNFYGPPRTINTVPYFEVLQMNGLSRDKEKSYDFYGKAVFVGVSENIKSEKKNDGFITVYSQPNGVDVSGVEIAATAFANLLEDMPVRPLGAYKYAAVIFFWGLIMGFFSFRYIPSILSLKEMMLPAVFLCSSAIVYLFAAQYYFKSSGLWLPLIIPLLQIPAAFAGSLLMKTISKERTGFGIYLFTDIRDFTKFSENMDPKDLRELMIRYFKPLSRIIEKHGGILETVPGDAMLARWEVTESGSSSAKQKKQSCLAALDIAEEISRFIRSSHEQLHTRIGLHCGLTSRGIIGSGHQRKNITFGDTVNTTQRVEELNKCLGTQILSTEEVVNSVDSLLTRKLGKFILQGKSEPLVLYELICPMKEATPAQRNLCKCFSKALDTFEKQSWEDASTLFNETITGFGQDGPSRYYLNLCRKFEKEPPEESWKGVVCMDKT